MPRYSIRQQLLIRLDDTSVTAVKHGRTLKLLKVDASAVEEVIIACRRLHYKVRNKRYLSRPKYRKRTAKFEVLLDEEHPDGLSDEEFRFHFRMCRATYAELVELLQDHSAFQRSSSDSRGPAPKPASHQLLTLLKYLGCEGNQASSLSIGNFFGVGAGVIDHCRNNALEAVLSLEDRTYFWPDSDERSRIAARIKEQCLFPHCVGLIDGALLPSACRPILHGENYLSRKRFYAIVMLVVCDDLGRILYYHVGWPGSVHDDRVWRTCRLCKQRAVMFSRKEHLLGDSAFTASSVMVPPFKTMAGSEMSLTGNKAAFNTLLAKPRVKSEHCIGILKGRFPFLRCIRLKLGNRLHMNRTIDYVRACVILHNYLFEEVDDGDWLDVADEDQLDDLDPEETFADNGADYTRRNELLYYLSELEETVIN